ncbi:thiamine pyrophosphate-dependent enzyme [Limnochorda pilosa]|uniref:2-oxoglutarate synthase n=1 Tax=Limnochorda pilosa TaxID=1555112 RepID=A0A0K2SPW5_LIMPI|nr:thiamine pyrophosphate-dependent enzyme [Limnochorda pilosa]BAS29150.1 2-oxoglutarate synthase [Limnochorda pilosa]
MSLQAGAPVAPETYLERSRLPFPFCPGCGHGRILEALDGALKALGPDPTRVAVVTDIGCVGLADPYLATHTFHGLHGRALTYATGLKLADPGLLVVVLMGDGGAGIGGNHILHAARRDVDLTLLVFDNFNFGMTGGQHSPTTPPGSLTATTPAGSREHPMDLCATVLANGARFAARTTAYDPELVPILADALRHPGFALVDVWELCTAYFARTNRVDARALGARMEALGMASGRMGPSVPEPRPAGPGGATAQGPPPAAATAVATRRGDGPRSDVRHLGLTGRAAEPSFRSVEAGPAVVVVAGAAGQRIRSSAALLAEAATASGLWARQEDDYPVTVQSGHSISAVELRPDPAPAQATDGEPLAAGPPVEGPPVSSRSAVYLLLLAPEALRQRPWAWMEGAGDLWVYGEPGLLDRVPPEVTGHRRPLQVGRMRGRARRQVGLAALAALVHEHPLVPMEALEAVARALKPQERAEEAQEALAAGPGLLDP